MKNIFLTTLLICFLSASTLAKEHLTLASVEDPISDISERVLISAYKQIGIKVEILKFPAERALNW